MNLYEYLEDMNKPIIFAKIVSEVKRLFQEAEETMDGGLHLAAIEKAAKGRAELKTAQLFYQTTKDAVAALERRIEKLQGRGLEKHLEGLQQIVDGLKKNLKSMEAVLGK